MKCPYCNYIDTKVVDSRESNDLIEIRRRRECLKCGKRFTTYEAVESPDLFVVKNNNSRELFDRNKVFRGIAKACEKRQISHEQIEEIVRELETKIRSKFEKEVPSKYIGHFISKRLYKLDVVAYIRFVSVYQKFSDINSFIEVIKKIVEDATKDQDKKEQVTKLFDTASEIIGKDNAVDKNQINS